MTAVLSTRSIRAIEKGIRAGRCMTIIPDSQGTARIFESDEFLTPAESEALLRSLPQPTPGTTLDTFIWEYECGNVKRFAAKVGYHPNRISVLKSATRAISARLFRRMAVAYKLTKKDRDFWGKRLLGT
jgi:hypothetical protein